MSKQRQVKPDRLSRSYIARNQTLAQSVGVPASAPVKDRIDQRDTDCAPDSKRLSTTCARNTTLYVRQSSPRRSGETWWPR